MALQQQRTSLLLDADLVEIHAVRGVVVAAVDVAQPWHFGVRGLEDDLAPPVEDLHPKPAQILAFYLEDVVDAVAVGGEAVGDVVGEAVG